MDEGPEQRCGDLVSLGEEMRVDVQCHAGSTVSGPPGDSADVDVSGDQVRRREMARCLVEGQVIDPDREHNRVKRRVTLCGW
jgi:hypothetical protein